MRRPFLTAVLILGLGAAFGVVADGRGMSGTFVDLTTRDGAASVGAVWRYSDTRIVPTSFRAPDSAGQPYGAPVSTFDIEPHAGAADFDDSTWPVIDPASLSARRGYGRLSFNWYRLRFTVPERVGELDTNGASVYFETRLDDYAEVWVDGELARPYGANGGSVVAGWNAENRMLVAPACQTGSDDPARGVRHERADLRHADELHLHPRSEARIHRRTARSDRGTSAGSQRQRREARSAP